MSKFLSDRIDKLDAYVPGEQPRERKYIKLNTNESPFSPHVNTVDAVMREGKNCNLYSDPESTLLTKKVAEKYCLEPYNVLMTNGSDEILAFCFEAYGDNDGFVFPNLTYGFYPVFCEHYGIKYKEISLREDFTIDIDDYIACGRNIAIANPNAPTGLTLGLADIERILRSNPTHVVIVDEAYVDFGANSAIPLLNKYDNLIVTRTFSKSFSLAGARLGFGMASKDIIDDLKKVKYSFNPYNVNRMTSAAGISAIEEYDYYMNNCQKVARTREWCKEELRKMGFFVTDSKSNFLFVEHGELDGKKLYFDLKERGILIRHFDKDPIKNYNRITIGTDEQMDILLKNIRELIENK